MMKRAAGVFPLLLCLSSLDESSISTVVCMRNNNKKKDDYVLNKEKKLTVSCPIVYLLAGLGERFFRRQCL